MAEIDAMLLDDEEDEDEDEQEEEIIIDDDDDEEEDSESLAQMDFGFDPEKLDAAPISRTYAMDHVTHRIKGFIDNKEAVMQSIWKILSTTRYAHYIYSKNYGCDVRNRIYNSSLSDQYLNVDVPAMVEEALMQDDRITGVSDFEWERTESDGVYMSFTAHTIYGNMRIDGEVTR